MTVTNASQHSRDRRDAPAACTAPRGECRPTTARRRARNRAALLALVWTLQGLGCAGHLLAHALEHGEHEHERLETTAALLTGVHDAHRHGHLHPEPAPTVASTEVTKKLQAPALLGARLEVPASTPTLRHMSDTAMVPAARRAAAVSGPRAPPIS